MGGYLNRVDDAVNESFKQFQVSRAADSVTFSWAWSVQSKWRAEDELSALIDIVKQHRLLSNENASWIWKHNHSGISTTDSCMQYLNSMLVPSPNLANPTDQNPFVPQKIEIFIWRAKQNKLPARINSTKKELIYIQHDAWFVMMDLNHFSTPS